MNKVFLKKIIAQNSKDLQIISACCSGSKIHIQDIKYLKENKLFLISLERFAKETEDESIKIQSILKFEFIDKSRSKNIDINNSDITLELLGIDLYKKENNYEITLLFLNNAFITLTAEVIEVTLEDQKK
tara:strand:+ start:472 stop:861 length:390 start_codon:yes stop_codon:yes gene_type:complete